jgi:hypothetical protein
VRALFIDSLGRRLATITNAVAVASDHVNRIALLADGRLMAWGLKQFYPNGPVVVGELGVETARTCTPAR